MDMTDARTLAYINMFGILGAIENLCDLAPEAKDILKNKKPVRVGLFVKGGPNGVLTFKNGKARMECGVAPCDIRLSFSSCEKFNGMIDGTVTPIPTKGYTKIFFLLKQFLPLTDLLNKYLRPEPEDLKDEAFFNISTSVMFYLISVAISQIGNKDEIGRFSASNMVDGEIYMGIKDGPAATIRVKDHHLVTVKAPCEKPRAMMEFTSMKLARDLFDGNVNAVACVGSGEIRMGGMMSMVDNLNRILDRVGLYLA